MYQDNKHIILIVILGLLIHKYCCIEQTYQHKEAKQARFHVAEFNFDHVADVYSITLWILLGSLAKVGFHLSHRLTEKFPESCLLIILGLIVGGLLYGTHLAEQKAYVLDSNTFFLFLLPPIIFEAGYFMPNRPFFDNLGTILLLAIVNTLFNTICIGLTLWGFQFTPIYGGTKFEMLPCLVFAALISAVDPVAVLATFTEIHVNDMLYIVVFGESLLNDAVSVVLYRMFDSFAKIGQDNLIVMDIVLGFLSFFVVALGGVLLGIVFGVIGCFTTKFTEHTPVLEPLIILVYAYLSYLTSEMLSVSGILALTFCGMVMKQYIPFNISKKSDATTEYVIKMLSSIMETIIFMFMGLSTVSDNHSWNTGFVLMTLFLCLLYRVIGVIIFANIANCWRLLELTRIDMLIMSYGGLRGAIAFALALVLDETKIERKKEFVTATIAVVFFTVFLQGITIGPLVKLLNVRRKQVEEPTMSAKLTSRMMDHVMTCLEEISGSGGNNSLRDKCRNLDRNYFKRFLLREKPEQTVDIKLLKEFKSINVRSAMRVHDTSKGLIPNSSSTAMQQLPSENAFRPERRARHFSDIATPNSPQRTVPDLMLFESQGTDHQRDDAKMHRFLDSNLPHARRRATMHLRNQDELAGVEDELNSRFEKLSHHRDLRYVPIRLTREQMHAISTISKPSANSNQSPTLTATPSIHDYSETELTPNQNSRTKSNDSDIVLTPNNLRDKSSTAAERVRPWRRSASSDDIELTSQALPKSTSKNRNDPNLHPRDLTTADVSNSYRKSSEHMSEDAAATNPKENSSRLKASDLLDKQSKNSSNQPKNQANTVAGLSATRL
ncbi:unnamed protein product [Rotaria socialis]|uniref:Sodium/hydrogen exchanger n=3 Tax=Rotaria TaxID=231623 RepID=A0A817T2J2_9BILA|nr:unnamed protein product [Rotaria socialis]CAF3675668.1 unnamed protein product [Rotaria socialis]CAF4265116.1 unnamed protein product [Rotaria socialis]